MATRRRVLRSRLPLKLAALVVSIVIAITTAEVLIRSLDLLHEERMAVSQADLPLAGARTDSQLGRLVVHPFRGFTPRPGYETPETLNWLSRSNAFGIRSMVDDPRALAEDKIVVGIFGGSVARGTAFKGRQAVREAILRVSPELRDRLQIVNFAVSGYKQPQQLYLLSELLLLGVPIDVVVNIDGYNEMALGGADAEKGFHPLYPEHDFWMSALDIATGTLSPRQIELSAEILRLRRSGEVGRTRLARTPLLRQLAVVRAAVGSYVVAKERQAVALEEELRRQPHDERERGVFSLSDPCFGDDGGCQRLIANLWRRSSEQMRSLAEDAGAKYIHAMQPNQYFEGTKPLSDEERAVAWAPDRPWSRAAASGYPYLEAEGLALSNEGVDILDLTTLFRDHRETLYSDSCCHYNQRGFEILGAAIGDRIGVRLTEPAAGH